VPQLAGVFGDCIAGGGYMPIISDRVYMTEQAYMVIAGAALIKGAKSQKITSLDIGGPEVHVHQSGCADVRVPGRRDLGRLPAARGRPAAVVGRRTTTAAPRRARARAHPPTSCAALLPVDHREAYDAHQVIARLVRPEPVLGGPARASGHRDDLRRRPDRRAVRRLRHQPLKGLVGDPDRPGHQRPAGILYRGGIAKVSAFSRACNDDGIPILWLHDISGFDIGAEAEAQGLLAYGSSLIYTNSTNQVPMFSVLLRKASGAGYYAMAGMPYDPVVQLSTCLSRLSVMEGRTLAIAAYNTKLDDDFQIAVTDPAERAKIEAGMREVEARIEADMDPFVAARQMDTDEIVEVAALRGWLVDLVEMSYQAIGYRRIKNPRIWSLHDLAELTRGRP
jgi:3-methylcrotonyl-CoA carboxylase beta subunit